MKERVKVHFSAAVIPVSVKPCIIVIVFCMLFEHTMCRHFLIIIISLLNLGPGLMILGNLTHKTVNFGKKFTILIFEPN